MNNKSFILKFLIVFTTVLFFASCTKDLNTIGSDIIGDDHFGMIQDYTTSLVAYNQATGVVQTDNLGVYELGVYNNPVFGSTKVNFLTEVKLSSANPVFDPTLFNTMDSVVLTIPYYSHITGNNSNNLPIYALDSITGSPTQPIDLKVFEEGYQIGGEFDKESGFQNPLINYSDETKFENNKIGTQLNDVDPSNAQYTSSSLAYKLKKRDVAPDFKILDPSAKDANGVINGYASSTSPTMALHLNKDYFYNKIIKFPSGTLTNAALKTIFKGLYFQANPVNGDGHLMKLNFAAGQITLYYTEKVITPKVPATSTSNEIPEKTTVSMHSFALNLSGNRINTIEQNNNSLYTSGIATQDKINGDERLYIKGGTQGTVALIDLFKNNELTKMRNEGWFINEANLTFHIDDAAMTGAIEPKRVYLYDVKNNKQILDWSADISSSPTTDATLNKYIFGGIIDPIYYPAKSSARGTKYKVRITNYLRNILAHPDSTNTVLGLSVTASINEIKNSKLKTANTINRVPMASVMNPLGTILYGSNKNVPENKRLKLEIYYTKPKN